MRSYESFTATSRLYCKTSCLEETDYSYGTTTQRKRARYPRLHETSMLRDASVAASRPSSAVWTFAQCALLRAETLQGLHVLVAGHLARIQITQAKNGDGRSTEHDAG